MPRAVVVCNPHTEEKKNRYCFKNDLLNWSWKRKIFSLFFSLFVFLQVLIPFETIKNSERMTVKMTPKAIMSVCIFMNWSLSDSENVLGCDKSWPVSSSYSCTIYIYIIVFQFICWEILLPVVVCEFVLGFNGINMSRSTSNILTNLLMPSHTCVRKVC